VARFSFCSLITDTRERFLQIVRAYTFLNPHLTLRLHWFGRTRMGLATNPTWSKWKPSDPTSPHWYTTETLARLIAGYVAHDKDHGQDRTTRNRQ